MKKVIFLLAVTVCLIIFYQDISASVESGEKTGGWKVGVAKV